MNGFAEGTPTQTITLNGKPYQLGFTLGAMRRAQELGILSTDAENETEFMLKLPEYVWICLDEDSRKSLSVEVVGEWMNPNNLEPIAEAVGALFKSSLPKEKPNPNVEAGTVKEPSPAPLTSKNSGQSEPLTSTSRTSSSGQSLSVSL